MPNVIFILDKIILCFLNNIPSHIPKLLRIALLAVGKESLNITQYVNKIVTFLDLSVLYL